MTLTKKQKETIKKVVTFVGLCKVIDQTEEGADNEDLYRMCREALDIISNNELAELSDLTMNGE